MSRDRLRFHCRMFNDSGGGWENKHLDQKGRAQIGCEEGRDLCECGSPLGWEAGSAFRAHPLLSGDLGLPKGHRGQ